MHLHYTAKFWGIVVPVALCNFLFVVLVAGTDFDEGSRQVPLEFHVERIETDLKLFISGADLDFNYNETANFPGDIVSSPGCPKSHEGRPWVYYGSPPKCYLVGFHGPCPHGKRIFSVSGSKYGVCNCECFAQEVKVRRGDTSRPNGAIIDYSNYDISQNLVLYRNRQIRSHSQRTNSNYPQDIFFIRNIKNPVLMFGKSQETLKRCNSTVLTMPTPAPSVDSQNEDSGISSYFLSTSSKLHNMEPKGAKERYSFCFSNWYKRQVVYDSLRQECTPFLEQGPCQNGEWLVRNLTVVNGVACEPRKCPEIKNIGVKPDYGGSYTYFDYRRQTCYTEVYGNLQESFFANSGGILSGNLRFCRDAGMRYSQRLKTCVRDVSKELRYKVIG